MPELTHEEQDELMRRQRERTRLRAYDIYLARGGTPGDGLNLQDWFQAESELWRS